MVAQRLLIRIRYHCAYNLAIVVAFIYMFLYKQESILYLLIRTYIDGLRNDCDGGNKNLGEPSSENPFLY